MSSEGEPPWDSDEGTAEGARPVDGDAAEGERPVDDEDAAEEGRPVDAEKGANAPMGSAGGGDASQPGGASRYVTAWTAGAAGVVVTSALALAGAFWPALAVLAGAFVASGLVVASRGGDKRYLLTGVVYCLGLALVVEVAGGAMPGAYGRSVLPAAGGLGAISGGLVLAKVAGKRGVRAVASAFAFDEEYWGQVWDALAAFGSLLSLAWLLVTFTEKVIRYTGVTVGAVGLLVANMLGYEVVVDVFGLEVPVVMTLFVGCVLLWFHLLDTLHNSWRAVVASAEKAGAAAGRSDADATTGPEG